MNHLQSLAFLGSLALNNILSDFSTGSPIFQMEFNRFADLYVAILSLLEKNLKERFIVDAETHPNLGEFCKSITLTSSELLEYMNI
jgi:hypothetical protein